VTVDSNTNALHPAPPRAARQETVSIAEFRHHLANYIEKVRKGSAVILTLRGEPVARLTPLEARRKIPFGALAGRIRMAPDFTRTPDDVIDAMEKG
jgi:prevent-host-death family protein